MSNKPASNKPYSLTSDGSDDMAWMDQDGYSHQSPNKWLFIEIMGGCGCGSSEEIADRARRVLQLFATPHEERKWSLYDDLTNEVLAHWLDHAGLLEHGSNITGSWLSDKGKAVHAALVAAQGS